MLQLRVFHDSSCFGAPLAVVEGEKGDIKVLGERRWKTSLWSKSQQHQKEHRALS